MSGDKNAPPEASALEDGPEDGFSYHAYVAYSEEDKDVALELTETLERRHFRCCFPGRDFTARELDEKV